MKMPLGQNVYAILGAAFIGVIGAAGMFLVEQYRQENIRHAMARDLARLDRELNSLRQELHQLQAERHTKKSKKSNKTAHSVVTTTTAEDYMSVSNVESSESEFYDLSDEEIDALSSDLEMTIDKVDKLLDLNTNTSIDDATNQLIDLSLEYPENPEILYRLGKAYYKLAELNDKTSSQNHINKGIQFCSRALETAPNHSEVHKWYAILIGSRADFQPIQDRIKDGHLFKKHVDIAISISPQDASLHHMLGRFEYEVAGLKWYERKIASALFGEPPTATYSEAFGRFLQAEELSKFDWKENRLMLAKCKIGLENYEEAVSWLNKALECGSKENEQEKEIDVEIKTLLEKYNSYSDSS